MALQMGLGIVTLRTGPGRDCFQYIGSQMESFLDHVLAGVLFVFGDKYQDFFFIFKVITTANHHSFSFMFFVNVIFET